MLVELNEHERRLIRGALAIAQDEIIKRLKENIDNLGAVIHNAKEITDLDVLCTKLSECKDNEN